MRVLILLSALLLLSGELQPAAGHGRLIDPPGRGSAWRFGFNTPKDYDDTAQYCGGFQQQWEVNKGKCGICGDAWDASKPRDHEFGGQFYSGKRVRRYRTGAEINIKVDLTMSHKGYFEFRLCPSNSREEVTQACLSQHLLRRADQGGQRPHATRYYPGSETRVHEARYKLPAGLSCKHCVLQWRYRAGNRWGTCKDGHQAADCGPQEEFRACADIAIGKKTKKKTLVVEEEGDAELTPGSQEVTATPSSASSAATPQVENDTAALDLAIQQYILESALNRSLSTSDESDDSSDSVFKSFGTQIFAVDDRIPRSFVNFTEPLFEGDDSESL